MFPLYKTNKAIEIQLLYVNPVGIGISVYPVPFIS